MNYESTLPYNEKTFELKKTTGGLELLALNYYLLKRYNEAQLYFEELY